MRQSRRFAGTAAPLGLLLGVAACVDRGAPAPPPEIPVFEGAVDLEVGEVEGEDPYLFTTIGSVVEDDRGRMIVADYQTHEVRVFEPDGRFAFRFGGQGEGPGEMTNPCCMTFGPDSLLWVRESVRYSAFRLADNGAEYARSLRSVNASFNLIAPVTFDAEGRLVDLGLAAGDTRFTRFHLGPGTAVDTVPMATAEEQATGFSPVDIRVGDQAVAFFLYQPFGPLWIHGHGPGGWWATAVSSAYAVTLHHPDGSTSLIQVPLQGPELSPDERQGAQARIDREKERFDLRDHPFGIPDRKPVLAELFFDRAGRLWVERTGVDGQEMREADVYREGTLVARYRWPRRVRVTHLGSPWVTETTLYGTTRDSLDVWRAARVRFTRIP
ncbi:6-bladed beta-propeller [Candidatus Palauibacter sp.]|uniref:6-bladed beta-propeller n=1 Tax=Candidatus Palauibacter sp. TaxID=3101350 RepID=UPI003B024C3F